MVTKEVKKLKDYTISEINEFLKAVNDIPNVTAFLCRDTKQIMLDYRVEGNTVRYYMNDEVDFKKLTEPRKAKLGIAEMNLLVLQIGKIEADDIISFEKVSDDEDEYFITVRPKSQKDDYKMSYKIIEDYLYRRFIKSGYEISKDYYAYEIFDCCDNYTIDIY